MAELSMQSMQWVSWVAPSACFQEAANPEGGVSGLDTTLAQQPDTLAAQACLYRAVMEASNGLCGAELELAAAAVSRANGRYIVSPRTDWLSSGKPDLQPSVLALLADGDEADPAPRWRALIDYAVAMSETPPAAGTNELASLRLMGFSDLEILDATHAIAMIAWVDRLRLTLGHVAGD